MAQTRFGILGPGAIANAIASALASASQAHLTAVSSRSLPRAEAFAARYPGVAPVEGVDALLTRPDIDAVYIATPTAAKESVALRAIAARKHVLVEKPFTSADSVRRIIAAAAARNVLFMDATHFSHHPRTHAIRAAIPHVIGTPQSLHTAFGFSLEDHDNIRFDPAQEPMGVLGDLAWYSARAIVEYLAPAGPISKIAVAPAFDPATRTLIRASGLIAFSSSECSTFDTSYTCGTSLMDLELRGTAGVLSMDDFVLDWTNSWAFRNPRIQTGYFLRAGHAVRDDRRFVETPSPIAQEIRMLDAFAKASTAPADNTAFGEASLQTQIILDAMWHAAASAR